jgi:hypothetical protein
MARQFKLRLRDGTILAVDQGGLRTWLIDDKAMVQPMGTRGWRPLKEILAEQSLAAAMKPPPSAPPAAMPLPPAPAARRTLSDADIPSIPIKPPPSLAAPRTADPVLDAPVDALMPDRIAEPEPAPAPRAPAPAAPVAASTGTVSPAAGRAPAPAAPPASRPVPAAAPPPARAAAPAAPAVPVARAAPTAATAPPPRAAAAAAPPPPVSTAPARPPAPAPRAKASAPARPVEPLIPEAPPEEAPVALEDLPIIPFKTLENEPAAPRVSVRVAEPDSQAETDLADQLALVIQREVAEGHAVVIREEDLEELDLVEDDRDAAREQPAVPQAAKAAAAVMATGVNRFVAWSNAALSAVRAKANALRATGPATRPGPAAPPPSLASLPVVPLAADPTASASRRRRVRVAGVAAALVAVAVAAGIGISRWMDGAEESRVSVPPFAPPPPPEATEPELPPEVAAVVQRLPHLAPDTVQVLIATSPFGNPDAPDVFRRARAAVKRGTATLPPEEAQELAVLERAVLVRLSPPERERVMAYDRLRAGRDLLPAEDARVLGLVARGARALPAEHRARLQALSGKAIAAALASSPPASPSAAASR